MAKYSKTAQKKIKKVMREFKKGDLRSGVSGKIVKKRKQAEAIGISEARTKGYKVPKKNLLLQKKTATKRKRTVKRTTATKRKTVKRK